MSGSGLFFNKVGHFFNKVVGAPALQLYLKKLQHRCFPVKFVKFLKTPFSTVHLGGCFLRYASNSNNLLDNFLAISATFTMIN